MRLRSTLRAVGLAALAAGMVVAAATDADAERQRWKLASSYGSNLDVFGENIKRTLANIETASDGSLKFQSFEPGAPLPALPGFAAVSNGSVDAASTSSGFTAATLPHATCFSSFPFEPNGPGH